MGYFSNGTEGEMYYAKYCLRCVHVHNCSVWLLHLMWNYDAVGKDADETKAAALNEFIPRDGNGENGECTMFVQASKEQTKLDSWNNGEARKL